VSGCKTSQASAQNCDVCGLTHSLFDATEIAARSADNTNLETLSFYLFSS